MNIDEFRALKAKMEQEQTEPKEGNDAQTESTTTGEASSTTEAKVEGEKTPKSKDGQEQTNQNEQPSEEKVETTEQTIPTEIEIDGQKVPIEELKKGYLRQSDYTKKTQEAQRKMREADEALKFMQAIQQNPQMAQQLSQQLGIPTLDPRQAQVQELENAYYDLLIEKELRDLRDKYGDFNEVEVLNTARDENLTNLETAYLVANARKGGGKTSQKQEVDIDKLKEQLREEIMQEVQAQQESQVDTSTIIQSGGDVVPKSSEPQLSPSELKVARGMGMNPEEYAKWRNVKSKKK